MTMQGEIKAGYKQTEMGVIPEDWSVSPLGAFGSFKGGNGFPLSYQGHEFGDYPFYKVSDMNNEGNTLFMGKSNHWVTEVTRKEIGARAFPAGSIIFAKIGAAIFLERKRILSRPSCIDNNVMALIFESDKADFRFFHYVFLTIELGKLVSATALPSLNGRDIAALNLAVPPLPEQRAIAATLADADGLIAALEGMIAKKRDIKQAAMQHLLTGKTRLPGFSGEWEVKRLGEVFEIGSSKRVFQSEWKTQGVPFYRAREIVLLADNEAIENQLFVSRDLYESYKANSGVPEVGDMLVTGVGTLGRVFVVESDQEFYFKDGNIIWFKIRGKMSAGFLRQLFLTEEIMRQIKDSAGGSTVGTYTISGAKKTVIPFPSLSEQAAIAEVLSDMDADLAALEARAAKARAVKQGMMQELLTGRVRLV